MSSASPNWLQAEYDLVISVVLAPATESSRMWTGSVDTYRQLLSPPRTTGSWTIVGPGPGTQQTLQSQEGEMRTWRAVANAVLQRAWLLDKGQKEGKGSRC